MKYIIFGWILYWGGNCYEEIWIWIANYQNIVVPEFENCTLAIYENAPILRKYMLKYLEVMENDICNISSGNVTSI